MQGNTTGQCRATSCLIGLQVTVAQSAGHKKVDRRPGPCGLPGIGWDRRPFGGHEGPVPFPSGSCPDPLGQDAALVGIRTFLVLRRRHPLFGVVALDPLHQLRFRRLTGDENAGPSQPRLRIQPEISLAGLLVGSVAGETEFRENRTNVTVEVDVVGGHVPGNAGAPRQDAQHNDCSTPVHHRLDHVPSGTDSTVDIVSARAAEATFRQTAPR